MISEKPIYVMNEAECREELRKYIYLIGILAHEYGPFVIDERMEAATRLEPKHFHIYRDESNRSWRIRKVGDR